MKNTLIIILLAAAIALSADHASAAAQDGNSYEKAVEYYNIGKYADVLRIVKPMAESGNLAAMVLLGRCYENGLGVPQDPSTAVKWYAEAARHGDAEAQALLGFAYESGMGVARDEGTAISWYKRAADRGYADAQYKLGLIYHEGRGVPEDKGEAARYFEAAAQNGNGDAQLMLAAYYKYGLGGLTKDESLFQMWKGKAERQGLQYSSHIFEKVQ